MRKCWLWMVPLLLSSADALAWGLYTHVYFAQLLLWAIPLADPRFARAVRRFPRLVLAGACLPDLSLLGGLSRAQPFGSSHEWESVSRLLGSVKGEEERALALGYASHLLSDVIAHNHFVPAHEHMWFEVPVLTHAVAEWTMDAHVRKHLLAAPGELLRDAAPHAAPLVARAFGCSAADAAWALRWLGRGEKLLRGSRLPQALQAAAHRVDSRLERRLDRYLRHTGERLGQINRVLAGDQPSWPAEVGDGQRRVNGSGGGMALRGHLAPPPDLFHIPSTAAASVAPMAAPASTSLG